MIPETPLLAVQQNMFVANPEGVAGIRELSRRDSQSPTMSLPSYILNGKRILKAKVFRSVYELL